MTHKLASRPHHGVIRISIFTSVLAAILATGPTAHAQENYPARPVRIVVPFAAGAAFDITARMLGTKLTEIHGQPVIVENRPGAGSDIGNEFVARAAPDGYTLGLVSTSILLSAALKPKLSFSPLRDFEHVAMIASFPQFLITSPQFGPRDMKSFIETVKKDPGKYNYASSGLGGIQHAVLATFINLAGLTMVHVPFAGGGPATLDVIANRSALGPVAPASLRTYLASKRVVPLAVASAKRNAFFPDVPTVGELGYPEFDKLSGWLTWQAIFAPAGTPKAIVDKINSDFNRALRDPDIAKKMNDLAQDSMVGSTPESTKAYVEQEAAQWREIVKRLDLKIE